MSETEARILNAQKARMRLLVWPREHGAWGILLIPLITGAWVGFLKGGRVMPLLPFALLALTLFCLRTPMESLLGTSPMRAQSPEERRRVTNVIAVLGLVAAASAVWLFKEVRASGLLWLGFVAALLFFIQAVVRKLGRRTRMLAQVIGAGGLTLTAPGAYYAVTGLFDVRAAAVWFANFVFAGNQIHFVQLRIRGSKCANWEEKFGLGQGFFIGQIAMMLALVFASAYGLLPWLALAAFIPVFLRGMVWFFSGPEPLDVHRLGLSELKYAIAFGALLIAGFQLRL